MPLQLEHDQQVPPLQLSQENWPPLGEKVLVDSCVVPKIMIDPHSLAKASKKILVLVAEVHHHGLCHEEIAIRLARIHQ